MKPYKSFLIALVSFIGAFQRAGAFEVAQLLYPPPDGVADGRTPFQWTEAPGAVAYSLSIGTSPAGNDLLDTGETTELYSRVARLPRRRLLYARLGTKDSDGFWTFSDSRFLTSVDLFRPARMVYPRDGAGGVDAGRVFEWDEDQIVSAYRLQVGTSPGASDLHDSGEIRVTRRFVNALPPGVPLYGRLSARVSGEWHSTDFTFTVSGNGYDASQRIETALWAVDFVRQMADDDNLPYGWTMLADTAALQDHYRQAFCSDYALALYYVLAQANVGMNARIRQMAFSPLDTHALVELNFAGDSWMILDPTFEVAARRSSDQNWASAEDISKATLSKSWDAISYVPLGPRGYESLRRYYLDYPLLFLNIGDGNVAFPPGQVNYPTGYCEILPAVVDSSLGVYLIQRHSDSADVLIDGEMQTLFLDPASGYSACFVASTVDVSGSGGTSPARLLKPERFVF